MQPRVLVGGVGYWWQRDWSFGLVACEHLMELTWPDGVEIAQLDYGALYVAQDLADEQPPFERVVLVAGVSRDRAPGRLYVRRWPGRLPDPEEIQARIREAGAGVIDLDHLLVISEHFHALPRDVVALEIEPSDTGIGEGLSPETMRLLPQLVERVREHVLLAAPVSLHALWNGK